MAKETHFRVYNLQRTKARKLDSPPVKIRQSRLNAGEWAAASEGPVASRTRSGKVEKTRRRVAKKKASAKLPRRALDVLRVAFPEEWPCLHCKNFGDDPSCTTKCYRDFKKQFVASQIDIKGPGPFGYGAYTKPGVHIAKGQYLDEYVGDLRPIDSSDDKDSLYCFEIPGTCVLDAERAGNWTRFINSSCRPNVQPWAEYIGGRHVIVFQAVKDIGPEEELVFNYGKQYFARARFECSCNAYDAPHVPRKLPSTKHISPS